MQESIQLVIESLPYLLKGAVFTLQLSIGGMFFGLLLGFVLALMRMSPLWPVRWLARFYISIFRGTPLIAQLFMIYYGLPQFGIELDPIPAAMIGLSLNTAAYVRDAARGDLGYRQGTMGSGGEHWHDAVANATSRYFAAGRSRRASAVEQQLYQPGERYVARRDDSGAGVVPPGAVNYLANAGGVYHVSGRVVNLLGNGDRLIGTAKLF